MDSPTRSPPRSKYNHVPLAERLVHLVGNPFRSDLTFVIDDDNSTIPAHKMIVALASPVLDRMVYGNEQFTAMDEIRVDGISRDAFMQILRFIYTDTIDIDDDNVFEILHQSNYFGLTGIESECLVYLNEQLSMASVPWIYHQLFHSYSWSELVKKCLLYIQLDPLTFFASEYFDKISVDEFKSILKMDAINCTEIDLFRAMVKLSKAHCVNSGVEVTATNQRKVLEGAEKLLQLETLSECEFLSQCLEIQNDFYSPEEIENIRRDIVRPPTVKTVAKRTWYTHRDAVWAVVDTPSELPPSVFHSGERQFVYRCSEEGKGTQVFDDMFDLIGRLNTTASVEVLCGSGYEWHPCSKGLIPPGAVPLSTPNDTEPMFIGRSLIETMWRVGHIYLDGRMKYPMELDHFSVDMDGSDDELGNACIWKCATDFEILVANNNVKKPYDGYGVPDDAVYIGTDEKNNKTYIGRSWFRGDLLPANLVLKPDSLIEAHVPFETVDEMPDNFDFLRLDPGTYDWIADKDGDVPEHSVIGGCTSYGETLYFGRVRRTVNNYLYGKIHPSHHVLYVPRRGEEIHFRNYEVLVHLVP